MTFRGSRSGGASWCGSLASASQASVDFRQLLLRRKRDLRVGVGGDGKEVGRYGRVVDEAIETCDGALGVAGVEIPV